MTIFFNPFYDSSVFLTAADCGLGKTFLGEDALLGELELRAGLTSAAIEHADRVIAYVEAMRRASNDSSPMFYSGAFERDDYGTAELMLGWRDALVRAGWDGNPVGDSEKIRVLSVIESSFSCPGAADRWRAILYEAAKRPILRPSDRVEVQCTKDALNPRLQALFDAVNSHYATPVVEYCSVAKPLSELADCRILEFDNEYAAHEWIASQDLGSKDVVAEADQALLGDILHILGKPGIGAADEGIGAVMRLLPLGLSLFKYPADINSLQSYLRSPRSPLDKLHTRVENTDGSERYPSTSHRLFDIICSDGGFSTSWKEAIEGSLYDRDGKELKEKDRKSALGFIEMWEKSKDLPRGEANVDDVASFIKGLDKWAGTCVNPNDMLNAQFLALQSNCKVISRLLGSWSGATIPVEKLIRWATHICVPINISSDYARKGSMNVVGNVADIYSVADNLIWFASVTDNTMPYEYEFLSRSETDALCSAGVLIPVKEKVALAERLCKLEGLIRCKRVTIVTCKRISGVETVPGALLAEIEGCISKEKGIPVDKTEKGTIQTDLGKAEVHHFNPAILEGFSRKSESYSSINTMLMSPVDYLLDYVKEYKQYGIDEVADLPTTEGNVAHAYIETLGSECGFAPAEMMRMHQSHFDNLLDSVISKTGLELCLEANTLDEKSFRVNLRESVDILLGIIIENNLTIVGFEHGLTADIAKIGPVEAKIDCLLLDPNDGRYVIIDFKYNSGKKYYRKIEKNRELQLAVYRKVVEKTLGEVKFIGYYAIPRRTLFTPENVLKSNPAIEEVARDESKDIFKMAVNGYIYRWEQLRKGILEEGEGLPLADLEYSKASDCYALEPDFDDNSLKSRAYGDKNITLKGGLK